MRFRKASLAAALGALMVSGSASASLTTFATFTGAGVGLSTDGWGSTTQQGTISASVPAGATVLAAYLYTSTFGWNAAVGGTLQGNALAFTQLGANNVNLEAGRMDVTGIVKPIIDGGAGGVYNFSITETSSSQDGAALVVVYSDPANAAVQTVGILDGFSATTGDSATINFAAPLDPTASGFVADMRLGIGFSFNGNDCSQSGQVSQVTVNGTRITNNAGCNDDSADPIASNGNLITVGGFDDPFSALLPATQHDHERYDLTAQITLGDTAINVRTLNPSNDDNIFLATFLVTGEASFGVPEPGSLVLLGTALAGLAFSRRRRQG